MSQKFVLALILLILAIAAAAQQKPKPKPTPETTQTYFFPLSAKEIADLEAKLKTSPADEVARVKLINYFAERETAADKKSTQRHRLALIENNPQSETPLPLGVWYEDDFAKSDYSELKNAWLKQISLNKADKQIRLNAASFFDNNLEIAEKILKDGQAIDRNDFNYSTKLIELYDNSMSPTYGESEETRVNKRLAVLKKIIAEAQSTLNLLMKNADADEEVVQKMLVVTAKYSLETGDLDLAKNSADELLAKLGDPKLLDSGVIESQIQNFQIADSVLGRIALRAGNVEKSKEYLMNSILSVDDDKNQYPKIDAAFLEEMLVRNGSRNVVEYLELFEQSSHLEDSGKEIIKEILFVLKRGKFPDFGGYASIY